MILKIKSLLVNKKLRFTAAALCYNVMMMVYNLVSAKFIAPQVFGLWQSVFLINSYLVIVQLGAISGFNRQLPFLLGKSETKNAMSLDQAIHAFTIACCAALLVVLCLYGSYEYFVLSKEGDYLTSFFIISIIAISSFYRMYLNATIRSGDSLYRLINVNIIMSITSLLLLVLVSQIGFIGFAVGHLVLSLLERVLTFRVRPFKNPPKWDTGHIRGMIKFGLPLYIMGYLNGLVKTFPRLALIFYGGTLNVGYFALASAVYAASRMIPTVFAQFVFPQMSYEFGKSGETGSVWKILIKYVFMLFCIGLVLAAIIASLSPFLVNNFFPAYQEGIIAMQIVAFVLPFMGTPLVNSYFFTMDNKKDTLKSLLVSGISLALFAFVLPRWFALLPSIAIAIVMNELLVFIFTLNRARLTNTVKK